MNIYLTQFGTISSFNLINKNQRTLHIYARTDITLDKLIWAILVGLFRDKMQVELKYTWEETEAIIDWLVTESALSLGLPKSAPTLTSIRSTQLAKLTQDSQQYLNHLGLGQSSSSWSQTDHNLYYSGKKIIGLTDRQHKLLEVLVTKQGQTVEFDELADVMWPSGSNFSLWAIVKEIARIRKCLTISGVVAPVLQSHRKLGYSLI